MAVRLDVDAIEKPRNGRIVVPYYDHWSNHPSNGLTPQKLAALLVEAEKGDLQSQSELYEDILDKEPTIFAALDTRKGAVLTKPWELLPLPNANDRRARKQIERIQAALDRASASMIASNPMFISEYLTFEDLRAYLLDATGRGFVAAQVEWDTKRYEPKAFKQFAQKFFIAGDIRKEGHPEYNPYELRLKTEKEEVYGEDILPHQFIFHFNRDKQGVPSRLGLLRTVVWWYLFGNYAAKGMIKFSERYGMPLVIGKYGENATEAEQAVLKDAVRNLGNDAAAVMSAASEITAMDTGPDRKGEIYQTIRHIVDQQISKAILGHASTTESTPGKLGAEDQAMQVQSYRIERDAKALDDCLNTQLIEPMAIWGEGECLCYIKTRFEPEEDLNKKADRYVKLITGGARIGEDHFYETFDIPKPKGGEVVITPPSSDPLAAAMAGAMGGQMANSRIPNAVGRRKAGREKRLATANDATENLITRSLREIPKVYAKLVDGLPADITAVDAIAERKDAFKADFKDAITETLRDAMEISAKAVFEPDLFKGLMPNKINPFKIKQLTALDWLEFQAFTLTQIEGEVITAALMKRIKDELINFVDSGMSPKEFYARVLDAEGVGQIGRGHLQTVLRTNIATARSAGTELAVDKNKASFPAWQFSAVNDDRVRSEHLALDGQVFRIDDRRYWPPLDFNCRCEASPIHTTEMEEENYAITTSAEQDTDVQRGFGADSRTNYARWVDSERRRNPELNAILSTIIGEMQ